MINMKDKNTTQANKGGRMSLITIESCVSWGLRLLALVAVCFLSGCRLLTIG
jgi:hypothetical protein